MATNQTFADFFAGQRMTLLAQSASVKMDDQQILLPALYTPGPTKPFDDKVQWPAVTWNRSGAPVIARGSPPRATNLGQTDWKFGTIFNMKEEMAIDFGFMQALASDYAPVQQNAMMELNRRMITFNQRTGKTRANMVNSLIANGKIWIGSDGQVLATSTGAVITMDPSIPTGNQLTKDGSGGTYNIGDWSAAATQIQQNIRTLQMKNVQTNGFMLKNIIYGPSIPDYLLNNTTLAAYLARNQGFRDYLIAENDVPKNFLGFNWTPARLAYLIKQNADGSPATAVQTFDNAFLAFLPDVTDDWYEFVEGGTQIPNGVAGANQVDPGMSMQAMAAMFRIAYGKYSYGVVTTHPIVGQSMVQGDCAGPVLKTPGTLYYGKAA